MKNEKQLLIITDADALIAVINPTDANHNKAVEISTLLTENNATVLTPVIAVIEAITALKRALTPPRPDLIKQIIKACETGDIATIDVPADIISDAIAFFNPNGSKQDTMFDAVIAAMAKRYTADGIFSFDKGYKKTKIPIVSDLLKL